MKKYDAKNFTWGYEIEWGDIDRRVVIPEHLGKWEYAETDIVNVHPPYQYIACDPLGLEPPMGGEINVKPTATWQEQVDRIMEIHEIFVKHGNTPSASCVNHGHVHVYVPGLKEDIDGLKRLIRYVKTAQHDIINTCYGFYEVDQMKQFKAKTYLKYDGGRPMPDYMCDNIENLATDFDSFIKLHAAGKDGVSMGRPFRYAINTYCMKHTGTIEFRCFRSTTNRKQIESQFKFVERVIEDALNGQYWSAQDYKNSYNLEFPPFVWNAAEYAGWEKTKYPKERGTKKREFHEV